MLSTIKEKWSEILNGIKIDQEMADVSFTTWLKPLEPVSLDGNTLTILYPGAHAGVEYIEKKYLFFLKTAINVAVGRELEVKLTDSTGSSFTAPKEVPFQTLNGLTLRKEFTFDNFVVGNSNKFAHAASLAVAESPAQSWNPLFIHGGVGLGKSHLLCAIANFVMKNNPNAKVIYTTCENFTNDLIDAIRNRNNFSNTDFREKYRNVDVLIIDDIQFLSKGEFAQEEIFNTFNYLYDNNKQIVFASDRPPKEIKNIDERISSRFLLGLTVEISMPDYETRVAILRKKEEMFGWNIDNEIINYIATNIKSNIRELEGALKKVVAFSNLNNIEISIDLAKEALKDHLSKENEEITPERIATVVADHFGIKVDDISSEKRNKEIAYPRQIAMYLCCELTNSSLSHIADVLHKKDHSTIIYGREKISKEIILNDSLRSTVEIIKKKLSPSG